MTLPTVASLWIGGQLSFLEQVCLKSFLDFGHRTLLYTYGEVTGVPEGVEVMDANAVFPQGNYIKHKDSGSPALHSDVFRYHMIAKEGVVWIDADVLCTQPWEFDTPFIYGWEKPKRLICGAVLGFPKESKTLATLLEFCEEEYPIPPWLSEPEIEQLKAAHKAGNPVHVTELKWGVWGPAALTWFLAQTGEVEHALPQNAFYPISFKDRRDLLNPSVDIEAQLGEGCYGVHLWNRRIRRRIVTHENGIPHPDSCLGRALIRHEVDPRAAPIPDQPPPHVVAERAKAAAAAIRTAPKPVNDNPHAVGAPPPVLATMPLMKLAQTEVFQEAIDGLEERGGRLNGWLDAPEEVPKNNNILVVTSMKNEAPFILEWVAYHLSIGATHFLVYTNDCTDNTNAILDRLQELGHVTRAVNPWDPASGKKPQHEALKDAVKKPCYKAADWVLVSDCDEFVNIHVGNGTFADLFEAANYPNVISLTWKFFGNGGVLGYEDRPITEQFTACAPEFIPKPRLGWGFKSMFHKSAPFRRLGVHRPLGINEEDRPKLRWVNGSGRVMPAEDQAKNGWMSSKRSLGYRLVTLNHYILRSAESFLVKRERGRINHTEQDQGIQYWTRRNYCTETDARILARLPRMRTILDEFHADSELHDLHEEAVAWHRNRITHLMSDPDYRALYERLVDPEQTDALHLSKEFMEQKEREKAAKASA
ncbi:glycosyltransferase family 2 protein [Pseudoruegeria sp. HB172150]|uniref:glycosyltransferase family 2 protein n=1 Tax=Pseudoruegeria sp. HB172150 TaxID=2721164 RepID=UPI001553D428|nr:glycosyltransferase family 2 protein [Pseudoruegeria sp. HB172150]